MISKTYYVYEHWRPDKDICFYVGKGKGTRYDPMRNRNEWHTRVKLKLKKLGMLVEVRMVAGNLTEQEALKLEIERIAFWKNAGVKLTNKTSGGDGLLSPTEDVLEKMRKASKKRWENPETRKLHGTLTSKGMKEKGITCDWNKGKKLSDDHKEKISRAHKGKIKSSEHIAKIAAKQIGNKKGLGNKSHTGLTASEETKAKMRIAQQIRREKEKAIKDEIVKTLPPKIKYSRKGAKLSAETKAKMSTVAKKRGMPSYVIAAAAAANKGQKRAPFSKETIEKMREAAFKREQERRLKKLEALR